MQDMTPALALAQWPRFESAHAPSTEAVCVRTPLLTSGSALVIAESVASRRVLRASVLDLRAQMTAYKGAKTRNLKSAVASEPRVKKKPHRSGAKEAGLWSREVRKRCPTCSLGKATERNL